MPNSERGHAPIHYTRDVKEPILVRSLAEAEERAWLVTVYTPELREMFRLGALPSGVWLVPWPQAPGYWSGKNFRDWMVAHRVQIVWGDVVADDAWYQRHWAL